MAKAFVKIGAEDTELTKTLKSASNKLQKFGKDMERVGMKLTQGLTVPIAGAAAAVFAFSEKSKAAFEKLSASMKTSLGRVGDDIAKTINLEGITEQIAATVKVVANAFVALPDGVKAAAVAIAAFVAVIGPALLIIGKFSTAIGVVVGMLTGPIGIVIAIGAAIAGMLAYSMATDKASEASSKLAKESKKTIDQLIAENEAQLENLRAKIGSRSLGITQPLEVIMRLENEIEAQRKLVSSLKERKLIEEEVTKVLDKHHDILVDFEASTKAYGETTENLSHKLQGLKNVYVDWIKVEVDPAHEFMVNMREDMLKTTDAIEKQADAIKRLEMEQEIKGAGRQSELQGGGVNRVKAARDSMSNQYFEMAKKRSKSGFEEPDAAMLKLREDIKALQTPWMEFVGLVQGSTPVWQELGQTMFGVFQTLTQGVSDAFAAMIVYGESLSKSFDKLFKDIASMIISAIIKIAIEWVARTVVMAFASAFASACAIPIIGPIIAPAKAAGAVAGLTGGLGGALAAGASAMSGIFVAAEGGIFTQPGITRIAERGRPEVVMNEENLRRHFPKLGFGGRRENFTQNITLTLDGRVLSKAVVRGLPEILRGI